MRNVGRYGALKLAGPLLAVVLGGCSVFGLRGGTEEPAYHTVADLGPVQIRQYAPRLAASVTVPGGEVESRAAGFRILARYIFGANRTDTAISMTAPVAQTRAKIAMTAPVAQSPAGDGWTITFTMPAGYTLATLPKPTDPRVDIHELGGLTAAVYRFSGIPGAPAVARARTQLLSGLDRSAWQADGAVMVWFYDPPWALPWVRRNEVAVPVRQRGG